MNKDTKIKLLEKLASELLESEILDEELYWKECVSNTAIEKLTLAELEKDLHGYFFGENDVFGLYEKLLEIDDIFELVSQDLRDLQHDAIQNILTHAEKEGME